MCKGALLGSAVVPLVFRCCLVVARFVCVCAVSVVADVDLSVGAVLHMGFIFSGVWD